MKWYQIKNKKPPEGEDVLVCFNPKNPCCCDVLAYESDGHYSPMWHRVDASYAVSSNDWWAKIELPKE